MKAEDLCFNSDLLYKHDCKDQVSHTDVYLLIPLFFVVEGLPQCLSLSPE